MPLTWNWSAFFFGGAWALYRKLYLVALAHLLIITFASMFARIGVVPFVMVVSTSLALALFADRIDRARVVRLVSESSALSPDEAARVEYLRRRGGVNRWVIWAGGGIVLLGLVATAVVPRLVPAERADTAHSELVEVVHQDLSVIMQALELYRIDHGRLPTEDEGLEVLIQAPNGSSAADRRGYLAQLPVDPWGRRYGYSNPEAKGNVVVFSLGADGRPGGEGADADIARTRR